MRFVCVSDTHIQGEIPKFVGDVLLHAGDLTVRGTVSELEKAADELAAYPCKQLVVIPGNHDILFEEDEAAARKIFEERQITVLIDQGIEISGVKIWGSPRQPEFCNWAFGYNRAAASTLWDMIPDDTEILITHGPPQYVLDKTLRGEHVGCHDLRNAVDRVKPKYHIFGHIHGGYGFTTAPGLPETMFINAALCDERYRISNPPIIFNYGKPGLYEK